MNPAWVRDLSPYHRQCIRDIGIRVFCVYRLVMLVVSGTCVLLEISNSVCTKYNEPTLLHATIYIYVNRISIRLMSACRDLQ